MPANSINQLLDKLEELKRQFGRGTEAQTEAVLAKISRKKFSDAESLIRFHEALLFILAYPQNAALRRAAQTLLNGFPKRIAEARKLEVDLSPLEHPEISGIAGMSVTDTFSYFIVRWLLQRYRTKVRFYWDWFEDENRLAQAWPRFMPLLEEDAAVEANVPYRTWLARVSRAKDLHWLIRQIDALPKSEKEKAEIYDAQQLYVRWTPGYQASRTGTQLPSRKIFYHHEPMISRRDVSLSAELEKPSPPLELLSPKRGEEMLEVMREVSTTRYRELYGFSHGDAKRVLKAEFGRGVEVFIIGVPPEWRLPLRAYHAGMIFKNGVPIGYWESLSLFERMESAINVYYTFRDGEAAWLYARMLNVFHHLTGVTTFVIDPYQLGHENEEGIKSGSFWFYRKLGFRPTKADIAKLVSKEEEKLTRRVSYRTSARTLGKLAAGSMILELGQKQQGDWDRFQVRNIGFVVQRKMASKFDGDAGRMRKASLKAISRILNVNLERWRDSPQAILSDFAIVLALVPDLARWTSSEKQMLVEVIRAKAGRDEARYLKLMQKHERLRKEIIRLGS